MHVQLIPGFGTNECYMMFDELRRLAMISKRSQWSTSFLNRPLTTSFIAYWMVFCLHKQADEMQQVVRGKSAISIQSYQYH